MISVVIPAHNEESVIGRCLSALTRGASPRELDVIVVCNACNDRTAEIAGSFPSVRVVETDTPGKAHALNLGDLHADHFPRVYLDADVTMDIDAARRLRHVLSEPGVTVAAPTMRVDLTRTTPAVRAYYRFWMQLPYYRERMVGSGVYAMSRLGRTSFESFPDLLSEDEFVRLTFDYETRRTLRDCFFTVHPPATLRDLRTLRTRWRRGQLQFEGRYEALAGRDHRSYGESIWNIVRSPRLWAAAPVYLYIWAAARMSAAFQVRTDANPWTWTRDWSARTAGAGNTHWNGNAPASIDPPSIAAQA